MKVLKHIGIIALTLFLTIGLPGLFYLNRSGLLGGQADAVTSASLVLPDQPSGEFLVLINSSRHPATLSEWNRFFTEQPVDVIMEDIDCMVAEGDETGRQLAERYQARLAENQMKLKPVNGVLMVSRAEQGLFDVVILSREMADFYDYSAVSSRPDVTLVTIKGE